MNSKKQHVVRIAVSTILAFFMSMSITILVVSVSLYFTVFEENYIINQLDDQYFQAAEQTLEESLSTFAAPSGFPDTIFNNLFDRSMIVQDTKRGVKAAIDGVPYTFDPAEFKNLCMQRFTKYAQDNGIAITDEVQANLNSMADSCVEIYKTQITIPFINVYASLRNTFENAFTFILIIVSSFLILIILLLFHIHPYKHRAVRYSICSLFGSSLMVFPLPLFFLIQGAYNRVNITPDYMRKLFATMVRTILLVLTSGGILLAIAGFMLMPLVVYMKDNLLGKDYGGKIVKYIRKKIDD